MQTWNQRVRDSEWDASTMCTSGAGSGGGRPVVCRAPRVRAGRRVRLLGDRVRGRAAADLGRRRQDDAGAVRGQRGSPDGSAADRRRVQRRRGHLHVVRPLAALRDRQPARRALSCSPISSTSTCAGRSISSTRGATSTSSTATTTTGSEPSWSRPTLWRSSATGHASSSRHTTTPRRRSPNDRKCIATLSSAVGGISAASRHVKADTTTPVGCSRTTRGRARPRTRGAPGSSRTHRGSRPPNLRRCPRGSGQDTASTRCP